MGNLAYLIALAAALFLVGALLADPRKSLASLEQATIHRPWKLIALADPLSYRDQPVALSHSYDPTRLGLAVSMQMGRK